MSTKKQRGLGKGLGAFFNTSTTPEENEITLEIEIEKVFPNPHQPRKTFDSEKLAELVASITQHGIIQPLIVRKNDNGYEIVAGERRWRAAKESGLNKVPAVVREYSDEQIMEIALVENIQRHDLNPIEEALAFRKMMEEIDLTQEEVAQKIGRSRSGVANVLRLLNLPEEIQTFVSRGTLNMGQARPLLTLGNAEKQIEIAEKIIANDMSAREVEAYIKKIVNKQNTEKKEKKTLKDVYVSDVEDQLALIFGTQVQIKRKGNKGKIVIDFYSNSDLERLLELFHKDKDLENKNKTKKFFTV